MADNERLRIAADEAFTVLDELWHDGYFPLVDSQTDRIEEVIDKLREAL